MNPSLISSPATATPIALFVGGITPLPCGEPSGIYKKPATGPLMLDMEGFVGDVQADRRVHGGPEKAVHHYPAEHYAHLAALFPFAADALRPGALGENISTLGRDESNVHLGDIFVLGGARLQVSQPRTPCWKINARFDPENRHANENGADGNIARHIGLHGCAGWYYRVLKPGSVMPDDTLTLQERLPHSLSLAALAWLWREHRPPLAALEDALRAPGLTAGWREKIRRRLEWLRGHAVPVQDSGTSGGETEALERPLFHEKPESTQ